MREYLKDVGGEEKARCYYQWSCDVYLEIVRRFGASKLTDGDLTQLLAQLEEIGQLEAVRNYPEILRRIEKVDPSNVLLRGL